MKFSQRKRKKNNKLIFRLLPFNSNQNQICQVSTAKWDNNLLKAAVRRCGENHQRAAAAVEISAS